MLSSPIILYDHPAIAPESAGDICDATEIDEILALRVLTLTDDEKAEARGTDPRAAAIVDRCDDMPPEIWARLHGAMRSLRPGQASPMFASECVPWWDPGQDAAFDPWTDATWHRRGRGRHGTRVRLRPSRRADAHDLFYAGRLATVRACSPTSTATSTWPSPSTTTRPPTARMAGPVPVLPSRRSRGRSEMSDSWSPASATSSSATTASASRSPQHVDTTSLPDGVTVDDFGIRGVHLAYELLDGYDALVLDRRDATRRPPGTVAIFEPDVEAVDPPASTPTR